MGSSESRPSSTPVHLYVGSRPADRLSQTDITHAYGPPPPHPSSPASAAQKVPDMLVECAICSDDKPQSEFPPKPPTGSCTHPSTVCNECLRSYTASSVTSLQYEIKCPVCPCLMEHHDVQRVATASVFARYDTLSFQRTLQSMPEFRFCKQPECGSGQIHDGGEDMPIMRCVACQDLSCFKHDLPWHYHQTCDEFDGTLEKDVNFAASKAYIASNAKLCPDCQRPIEKDDGCDHMTCRKPVGCGHQFCWLCLAPFDPIAREGNHRHRPTCQHYAPWVKPSTQNV
ncbi:hypothetical protein DL93DRAFT_2075402 [Clavulina sp. PMI_390]|nr:hypothetical protein DL93DRAFT_2075402 [Clavulina sp. PMI_390]